MWWRAKWLVPKPTPETEKEGLDPVGYYDVSVPPGLHTFVFRSDVPAAIRLKVDDPKMFVEGARGVEFLAVAGRWIDLEPHTFGATFYRSLGPSDLPILADVSSNARLNSPVRIASRMRLDTRQTAPKGYSVFYDLLDAGGNVLSSSYYEVPAFPSPFDYYEAEAFNPHVAPSAVHIYQLPIPPNARTLRVRTSQVAEIAFYAQDPAREVVYRVPNKFERSRDILYIDCENPPEKEWRYFRPENYADLERQNRSVGVRWFCRALRRKSEEDRPLRLYDAAPVARVIKPDTLVETVEFLERYRPSDDTELATDATFFETPLGKPFRLRVVDGENPHHRLPVGFELIRSKPSNRPVRMWLDGAPFQPVVFAMTAGRQILDEVPQGLHTIRFEDEPGVRLFVNREPEPSTTSIWKRRTSYLLRRATPIFVTVPKPSLAAQTLNVVVYAKDASTRWITAQIANPPPLVPGPDFAWQTRTYQLDSWEPLEGFNTETGERYTKRLTLPITLNEAFPPRDYYLRISLTGGQDVAVRFLVMGDEPFEVTPNRDAVLNLIGPGHLWVRWDGASRGSTLASTRWNNVGEAVSERVPFVMRTIFPEAHLVVPPGLHTYFLNVPGSRSASLYFYVDNPSKMLLGRFSFFGAEGRKPALRMRIMPDTYTRRYYATGTGTPAVYAIPATSSYLRVDARRVATAPVTSSESAKIRYVFTDAKGRKTAPVSLSIALQPPTKTDAVASQVSQMVVSGASYGYIRVPPGAKAIALTAEDSGVLLSLDAQLPDFTPDTYLPEDTSTTVRTVNVLDSAHNTQWMPLTPTNHDAFFFDGRFVDVVAQKVAIKPEPPAPILPTRFWTAFAPEGAARPDLEVLEPLDTTDPTATPSEGVPVASVFEASWREVSPNALLALHLRGLPGFRETERDVPLAYLAGGETPVRLTVWIDGAFHSAFELIGRGGTSVLRGVPLGPHQLELRTEPSSQSLRLFVFVADDEMDVANETLWSKRAYYRLEAKGSLAVTVTKPTVAPYSVNIVGYVPPQATDRRLQLRARIEPMYTEAPQTGVTPLNRVFYIPAQRSPSPVLPLSGDESAFGSLGEPLRFTLLLKEDIGVGNVRIVLWWEEEATGYFRFFGSAENNDSYDPGEVAVLNVVGPGRFRIEALDGGVGDRLRVFVVTPEGVNVVSDLRWENTEGIMSATLPLSTECATVRVENASSRRLRLRFYREDDSTRAEVRPRYATQTFYTAYPHSPVVLLIPPEMREDQTLRVTVRRPIPRNGAPETAKVRFRLLDAQGGEVSSGECVLTLAPSEEARDPDSPTAAPPSETALFYVEATRETASIELVSDAVAMFRLHRRLASTVRETIVPDDYLRTEGVRVRSPIVTSSEWEPVEPLNGVSLALGGRAKAVNEPVALAVALNETATLAALLSSSPTVVQALEPLEEEETVLVMEPSLPKGDEELTTSAATFFRIRPNAETLLSIVASNAAMIPTNIRLLYRLSSALTTDGLLGETPCSLRVVLDGSEVAEVPLVSPQGFVTVPDVMPGLHRLRVSIEAKRRTLREGIELFVNHTPTGSDNAIPWKLRTVHTLQLGESSIVTVEKREQEELSLNVVAYPEADGAMDAPIVLSVTIDDGIRRGNVKSATEVFTSFRRLYRFPNALSTAFYLNRRDETPGRAQTFFVPLLNDLTPGVHRIQIRLESGAKRVGLRYLIQRNGEVTDTIEFRQSESEDVRS